MKKTIFILLFTFLITGVVNAQNNKKDDKNYVDPDAALKAELVQYKKDCRVALKPYRYDGQKTTFFSYKAFEYLKEIEVATIQDTDYRISINAKGIHDDKIKLRIYDKPKDKKGRVLLYEKEGVGGNVFTFETSGMLETLKKYKREKGVEEEIIQLMSLKKLYIDYIIPATERETQMDEESGKEKAIVKRGAIIICIGYRNL